MTMLYGDYLCPECKKEGKLMHEINDGENKIIFPGESLKKGLEIAAECEYCNEITNSYAKVYEEKFVGFANKNEINDDKFNKVPKTKNVFEKWKKEKAFSPSEKIDFNKQPFAVGKEVNLSGNQFTVQKIYRTEWVEKDLDIRLEHPRPDIYWYEVSDKDEKKKWLKVENVEDENTFLSEDGIIVTDNTEIVEEMTNNPTKIKRIYKTDWFGGRGIEAYQYVNGVRILVTNHKNQIEMDIFEDTFEEAMATVEENMELGVFNE